LLMLVAWRMSDARHFVHTVRCAPRSDVAVLLTCFALTVVFDMVVAVSFGVVMASLLFMRRMAEVSGARLVGDQHHGQPIPLPSSVQMYEVAGPLFFGAAQKAMRTLDTTQAAAGRVRVVILDMRGVPSIDATGAVALESALGRLDRVGVMAVLAGVQPGVRPVLTRHGLTDKPGKLAIIDDFRRAVNVARLVVDASVGSSPDHPIQAGDQTRVLGSRHREAVTTAPPSEPRS
ncbi:MAG: STAS domain-containing protein, partial [Planctomycetota bacterium]